MYDAEMYYFQDFEKENKTHFSDGECILDVYQRYGESFTTYLDGEFVIVLSDFIQNKIIVETGAFE